MASRVPLPRALAHGPFTVAEGMSRGLSEKRLRGGDLHRPFRGVRSASEPASLAELTRSALRRLPGHAFAWGPTAALLQGIPLPLELERATVVHVAVAAPRRAPGGRGIRGHRVSCLPRELRVQDGIPMTIPERTWCDLGALLVLDDLVVAGDRLIARGRPMSSLAALRRALDEYPSRRGVRALRTAFGLLDDGSESPGETRLRLVLVRAGIRGWRANLEVRTSGGFRYRLDFAFPEERVALEYQGDYHRDVGQFRRDMTRIERLQADGWHVIQVNADDLRDPLELVERLRRVLLRRRAGAR